MATPADLLQPIVTGTPPAQRRAIAKAITLLESTRADHRAQGDELLTALLPHTGNSLRLGISGVPGVGKSTFIESLGVHLIERGHRVAVLAIDPSSTVSGGSILGDKTRMERLSTLERAYIRPSPSSGILGGGGSVSALLGQEDAAAVKAYFAKEYQGKLSEGIEIESAKGIFKGFRVGKKGGQVFHDFSKDAIADSLSNFLRAELTQIVKEAAKQA